MVTASASIGNHSYKAGYFPDNVELRKSYWYVIFPITIKNSFSPQQKFQMSTTYEYQQCTIENCEDWTDIQQDSFLSIILAPGKHISNV